MSLVAIKEEKIVGHILYTTAVIESKRKQIKGMGLAPIATLPEYQNK
jgi:putative acetyltransferase